MKERIDLCGICTYIDIRIRNVKVIRENREITKKTNYPIWENRPIASACNILPWYIGFDRFVAIVESSLKEIQKTTSINIFSVKIPFLSSSSWKT